MLVYGTLEIDENEFIVRRAGLVVPVQRQALVTVIHLMRRAGCLVTRQELSAGPWRGSSVSEDAIYRRIMRARRVVDQAGVPNPIETVRGVGFRFTGVVRIVDAEPSSARIVPARRAGGEHLSAPAGSEELTSRVQRAISVLEEAMRLAPRSGERSVEFGLRP